MIALTLDARAYSASPDADWAYYHADPGGSHYSRLDQINTRSVAQLVRVWRFDAGNGGLQTTPLVIDRTLYAYRTDQQVVALDAVTGVERWTFNAGAPSGQPARGLTWWNKGRERRLFASVKDALYALDPDTGHLIASFGEGGKVDLRKGLSEDNRDHAVYMTSPGVIYDDLIIVGFRTSETAPAAPGAIRAYDVRTGKLRWIFYTIPRPGQPGHETWPAGAWKTVGGANNWAGMVVDDRRGIVFPPMARPSMISMARTATAIIATRTACWRSMLRPAACSGTSKACITTSGIGTSLLRRYY